MSAETGSGSRWPAAPKPVPGCLECANHSTARAHAREAGDGTAETDANIRLRRHLREAHA